MTSAFNLHARIRGSTLHSKPRDSVRSDANSSAVASEKEMGNNMATFVQQGNAAARLRALFAHSQTFVTPPNQRDVSENANSTKPDIRKKMNKEKPKIQNCAMPSCMECVEQRLNSKLWAARPTRKQLETASYAGWHLGNLWPRGIRPLMSIHSSPQTVDLNLRPLPPSLYFQLLPSRPT